MTTNNLDTPYALTPTDRHKFQIRAKCYAIIVKWTKGHKKGLTLRYHRRYAYQQGIGNLSGIEGWGALAIARTVQVARLKSEGTLGQILPPTQARHLRTGEPMMACPVHGATEWTFHPSKEKNLEFIGYCNRCNAEARF